MAVPTLVQHVAMASCQGNGTTFRKLPLPNVVLNHNFCVFMLQNTSGRTPSTFTDDKSNTWTLGTSHDNGDQNLQLYYCADITNGPTEIRISYSPSCTDVGGHFSEWYNIKQTTPGDGSSHAGASSNATALNAGSYTPAVSGDLIISSGIQTSNRNKITSWTKGTGYTFLMADREDSMSVVYRIQATAGNINETEVTQSPSQHWCCVAMAFQNASFGTAPTQSPRVVGLLHQAVNRGGTGATEVEQLPCFGTTQIAAFVGVASDLLTGITDTAGNTYTAATANSTNGGSGNSRQFYAKNATPSDTNTVTFTVGGAGAAPGDTCWWIDAVGLDLTSPIGTTAVHTGTGASTSFSESSYTPSAVNSIVVSVVGVTHNTVTDSSPADFQSSTDTGETSPWPNDENNGVSLYATPNTSAVTNVWTTDAAADEWASSIVEYKAAASDTLMGQACM